MHVIIPPHVSISFQANFQAAELGPALLRLRSEPSAVAKAVEALREELCSADGEAALGPFLRGGLGWFSSGSWILIFLGWTLMDFVRFGWFLIGFWMDFDGF